MELKLINMGVVYQDSQMFRVGLTGTRTRLNKCVTCDRIKNNGT
jgi:hypothetical protein